MTRVTNIMNTAKASQHRGEQAGQPARTLPSLQAVKRLSQKHAERVILYHQRACEADGCSMHMRATHLMAKRRRRSKFGHALLPRVVPVACCLARRIHDFAVLQHGCKQGPVCCLCLNPFTCSVHNCASRKRRRVSDAESKRRSSLLSANAPLDGGIEVAIAPNPAYVEALQHGNAAHRCPDATHLHRREQLAGLEQLV